MTIPVWAIWLILVLLALGIGIGTGLSLAGYGPNPETMVFASMCTIVLAVTFATATKSRGAS